MVYIKYFTHNYNYIVFDNKNKLLLYFLKIKFLIKINILTICKLLIFNKKLLKKINNCFNIVFSII
jgi:hypothetical protein